VLRRDEAYIGVMVDDLVTKPFDEPYRMLTSRAEFRLSLRPSTADRRLAGIAYDRGLIPVERAAAVAAERDVVERWMQRLQGTAITPSLANQTRFGSAGLELPTRELNALDLLRRTDVSLADLATVLGPTLGEIWDVSPTLRGLIEEEAKYSAFIARERREVERRASLEHRPLPADLDYAAVAGLRIEASSKLARQQPRTIGEASRMMGVTPADVAALLIHTAGSEAVPS
jgi:tRNA uridine 5-carboxymethylaminomethyl modification enzyme